MVFVHDIQIENYYSIGNITYSIEEGIYKLSGSNGQGKTSLCSALSQCLYNKSIKNTGTLIEDTYNKVTKRPYRITVNFTKDDKKYTVINDREANNITVLLNGTNISPKGIKNQLELIKDIIGIDYDTFISLTYLSQSSMNSVFDLADTNNILHKFFDVSLITFLEKNLKVERRELSKHVSFLTQQEDDLKRTISSLEKYQPVDTTPFVKERLAKQALMSELVNSSTQAEITVVRNLIESKKDTLDLVKEPLFSIRAEIKLLVSQSQELKDGKCPVCGSDASSNLNKLEDKIKELKGKEEVLSTELEEKNKELQELKDTLEKLEYSYNSKVEKLNKEISSLNNMILVAEEKNKGYEEISKESKGFQDKLQKLEVTLSDLKDKYSFVDASLSVITSGAITKQYVKAFLSTFNQRMGTLCEQSDIEFNIKVLEDNGKINYIILNSLGSEITFENLSSGERTRVSLIILLGIVDTLEILTNVSINILMLDELLSVLDKEGVGLFMELLNSYRDKKHLWVIQHHEEIPNSYFDGIVRVKKEQELTQIFIENK